MSTQLEHCFVDDAKVFTIWINEQSIYNGDDMKLKLYTLHCVQRGDTINAHICKRIQQRMWMISYPGHTHYTHTHTEWKKHVSCVQTHEKKKKKKIGEELSTRTFNW